MESVGCIHYTSESRTYDYPGSEGCDDNRDTEPDWYERCNEDCPGYEEAA